jgi:NADH-quinone oxidoreductase subunit M
MIADYTGLLRVMPVFTIVFLITALSSMGLPPLNGFIGEITILRGVYEISFGWAFACVAGIALGAAYLLWLFQRTMLGTLRAKQGPDRLSLREIAYFAPLLLWAFWIGLYPAVLRRPRAARRPNRRTCQPGYHAAQPAQPAGYGFSFGEPICQFRPSARAFRRRQQ